MKNSARYFCNKECEYYPCHDGLKDLNCLFCFCPLYHYKCPGQFKILHVEGKKIKDCSECTYPHNIDHYDAMIQIIKKAEFDEDQLS